MMLLLLLLLFRVKTIVVDAVVVVVVAEEDMQIGDAQELPKLMSALMTRSSKSEKTRSRNDAVVREKLVDCCGTEDDVAVDDGSVGAVVGLQLSSTSCCCSSRFAVVDGRLIQSGQMSYCCRCLKRPKLWKRNVRHNVRHQE